MFANEWRTHKDFTVFQGIAGLISKDFCCIQPWNNYLVVSYANEYFNDELINIPWLARITIIIKTTPVLNAIVSINIIIAIISTHTEVAPFCWVGLTIKSQDDEEPKSEENSPPQYKPWQSQPPQRSSGEICRTEEEITFSNSCSSSIRCVSLHCLNFHIHLAKVGHKRGSGTWTKIDHQRTTSSVTNQYYGHLFELPFDLCTHICRHELENVVGFWICVSVKSVLSERTKISIFLAFYL